MSLTRKALMKPAESLFIVILRVFILLSAFERVHQSGGMILVRLLDNKDKAEVMEYIYRNEMEAAFLCANVLNLGLENDMKTRRCGDYYGFFSQGEIKGVLPFYNLGSCIPHYETKEAIPVFAQIMRERSFEYLLGMQKIVLPLYEQIKDSKKVIELDDGSYFVNRDFRPYTVEGLEFVEAREAARDERAVEFLVRVRNIGFGENVTGEEAVASLGSDPEEDAVIAVANGEYVAFAKIQTYTRTLNQIGSVYTEEAHRGRGYCKAVVSEICRRIVARGKIPTLFARKDNPPAVKAYTALGFEPVDDYSLIRFE